MFLMYRGGGKFGEGTEESLAGEGGGDMFGRCSEGALFDSLMITVKC
jgi:hypothetical protein